MNTDAIWYYAQQGQRRGPVDIDALRMALARSEISWADLVWCEGMPEWVAAGAIPALGASPAFDAGPALGMGPATRTSPASSLTLDIDATASSASPPPPMAQLANTHNPAFAVAPLASQVDYFRRDLSAIPERAIATLAGHASPAGDTTDWPLDDARIAAFSEALRLRKRITAAANLFKLLGLLCIFVTVVVAVIAVAMLAALTRATSGDIAGMVVTTILSAGFTTLYFLASRATVRSRRWGALTFFIIYLGITVLYAGFGLIALIGVVGMGTPVAAGPIFLGMLITVAIGAAFAVVAWRAFAAIPRFLAAPAWCQEILVISKL